MNKTSDQIALQIVENLRKALGVASFTVVSKEDYDLYRDGELDEEETVLEAPHFTTYSNGCFTQFVVGKVENGEVHGLGMYDDEGETCTIPVKTLTADEVLALAPYLPKEFLSFPLYHVVAIEGETVKALNTYTEECPDIANTFLRYVEGFGIEGDTDELLMDGIAINNSAQNSVVMYRNFVSAREDKEVNRGTKKTVYALHNLSDGDDRSSYYVGIDMEKLMRKLRSKQIPEGASSVTYGLESLVEYDYFTTEKVVEDGSELPEGHLEEVQKTVEVVLMDDSFYFTDPGFDYDKVESPLYDL